MNGIQFFDRSSLNRTSYFVWVRIGDTIDRRHLRDASAFTASTSASAYILTRPQTIIAATDFSESALHGYPASVVFEQSQGMEADLISIGKHGGGALEEQLLGSVTQNILYHAKCDVLLSP